MKDVYRVCNVAGLYARSKMMRNAAKETQELCIPLSLLHPFWNLDCLYPQKKIVECILKTRPDSSIFIKSPEDQNEYRFEIQVCIDKYCMLV